jgi:NAD(P)-dependent dehydrogenase (short-subunit alcohol dehydrogenase family)
LDGRGALITGASSGIGEATARAFVREGASVALVARHPAPLERLAASLGEAALAISADVSDSDAVASAVREAVNRLGRLDVAVNSAGVVSPLPLADLDARAWQETIDTNLSGSFYVAREAGLRMAEDGGGSIVNLASDLSVLGMPMYVAYCASKAGVIGLTKALEAQ